MKHTRYRSDYDERSAKFVGYREFLFGSGLRLAFWERSDSVTGGEKSMARSTDAGNERWMLGWLPSGQEENLS